MRTMLLWYFAIAGVLAYLGLIFFFAAIGGLLRDPQRNLFTGQRR